MEVKTFQAVYSSRNKMFDAIDEILDLQRNLHASASTLREEYTFGIQTLFVAFLFLSKRVALRPVLGSPPTHFVLALQLSALVSWRSRCVLV